MKKAGVEALAVEDEIFTRFMGRPSIELPIELTWTIFGYVMAK
jgi:hypothetical protein